MASQERDYGRKEKASCSVTFKSIFAPFWTGGPAF